MKNKPPNSHGMACILSPCGFIPRSGAEDRHTCLRMNYYLADRGLKPPATRWKGFALILGMKTRPPNSHGMASILSPCGFIPQSGAEDRHTCIWMNYYLTDRRLKPPATRWKGFALILGMKTRPPNSHGMASILSPCGFILRSGAKDRPLGSKGLAAQPLGPGGAGRRAVPPVGPQFVIPYKK
jgi:hypothetical protein